MRYHLGLCLEVAAHLSVVESYGIAEQVRHQVRQEVPQVADVQVHEEPAPVAVRIRVTLGCAEQMFGATKSSPND